MIQKGCNSSWREEHTEMSTMRLLRIKRFIDNAKTESRVNMITNETSLNEDEIFKTDTLWSTTHQKSKYHVCMEVELLQQHMNEMQGVTCS